jgi:hypothetical protein
MPDSAVAAGNEIGPENTLKVETRVQIPLGLRSNDTWLGRSITVSRGLTNNRSIHSGTSATPAPIERPDLRQAHHVGEDVGLPERLAR